MNDPIGFKIKKYPVWINDEAYTAIIAPYTHRTDVDLFLGKFALPWMHRYHYQSFDKTVTYKDLTCDAMKRYQIKLLSQAKEQEKLDTQCEELFNWDGK